ncbi:hypothetical protein RB195_005703 [Necator americanus]|uniref:Uncharacterized protein n=1 Tax=Necator americanus TaxID=51031 RepID=A0ABR1BP65_NECAM
MRSTVDQYPLDIILGPSGCLLTDLEYAGDVVIAESNRKLQHIVNLVSKLAAAYRLCLHPVEMLVVDSHYQRSQTASLPIRNLPRHDVQIGSLGSTVYGDGEA